MAADGSGVTYLCSDCGAWPGGDVRLNWKQWHALEGGLYGVVTVPGSRWSRAVAALPTTGASPNEAAVRLAYSGPSNGILPSHKLESLVSGLPVIKGHVF